MEKLNHPIADQASIDAEFESIVNTALSDETVSAEPQPEPFQPKGVNPDFINFLKGIGNDTAFEESKRKYQKELHAETVQEVTENPDGRPAEKKSFWSRSARVRAAAVFLFGAIISGLQIGEEMATPAVHTSPAIAESSVSVANETHQGDILDGMIVDHGSTHHDGNGDKKQHEPQIIKADLLDLTRLEEEQAEPVHMNDSRRHS